MRAQSLLFCALAAAGLPDEEVQHADEDQSYEWVQAAHSHGAWSREFAEALVRNAQHRSVYRIQPDSEQRKVIQWLKTHHSDLVEQYNDIARHSNAAKFCIS